MEIKLTLCLEDSVFIRKLLGDLPAKTGVHPLLEKIEKQVAGMATCLTLTLEEVNVLLTVLGDTPTRLGAYPIMMAIKEQGEEQVKGEAK